MQSKRLSLVFKYLGKFAEAQIEQVSYQDARKIHGK